MDNKKEDVLGAVSNPSQPNTDASGNQEVTLGTALDEVNDAVRAFNDDYSYHYQAAAAANVVVKASAGYLKGIILGGLPVADAIIEVSDHASDGDGNVQIFAIGGDGTDALLEQTLVDKHKGYIPVECYFATGICADIANQTHVTFIFR
jgi:hypothetical protein